MKPVYCLCIHNRLTIRQISDSVLRKSKVLALTVFMCFVYLIIAVMVVYQLSGHLCQFLVDTILSIRPTEFLDKEAYHECLTSL